MSNFWDRIALKYVLNPLGKDEVRKMLQFRLEQAGYKGKEPLFNEEAMDMIWEHTQGYPRKLSLFCHNSLETLVMFDKKTVDADVVKRVVMAEVKPIGVDKGSSPINFDEIPDEIKMSISGLKE